MVPTSLPFTFWFFICILFYTTRSYHCHSFLSTGSLSVLSGLLAAAPRSILLLVPLPLSLATSSFPLCFLQHWGHRKDHFLFLLLCLTPECIGTNFYFCWGSSKMMNTWKVYTFQVTAFFPMGRVQSPQPQYTQHICLSDFCQAQSTERSCVAQVWPLTGACAADGLFGKSSCQTQTELWASETSEFLKVCTFNFWGFKAYPCHRLETLRGPLNATIKLFLRMPLWHYLILKQWVIWCWGGSVFFPSNLTKKKKSI